MLDINYIIFVPALSTDSSIDLKQASIARGSRYSILIDTHPDYEKYGSADSIGLIKFRALGGLSDID